MPSSAVCHDPCICVVYLIHTRDTTYRCVWHGSFLGDMSHPRVLYHSFMSPLIHMCDTTKKRIGSWFVGANHSCMWHARDSFMYNQTYIWVTQFIYTTHSYVLRDSFMCVIWCILIWHTPHPSVWHGSFIHVTGLTHLCDMAHSSDMTNSSMWHNSFIRVTCLIELWYATHPYLSNDVFTCVTHQHECLRFVQLGEKCVTWWHYTFICCIHMCEKTHS